MLDEKGELLLSLSSRLGDVPHDVHSMLSNADIKHPVITLHDGKQVTLTYGQYNALLQTNRHQPDRAAAFEAFHETFAANANTYAAVYNGVLQRDWFIAQARQFTSTLEAALHGNDIPPSVVENLVATAKAGPEPLRRYHRLRKRVLGLETYHAYDQLVPLIDCDRKYAYSNVLDEIVESMKPLGPDYQQSVRQAFEGRWIDVYENPGKRSGAYSAPVYGVHPYMLLNYNDTLDSVFTLAHEMGHSMHTMLSEAHQPFVYSDYTIFVAEVPSTLSEMLFFDHMLSRTTDQRERIVLLQHAIDDIVGTFYRQCLFADYELQAHRLAEQGEPITAEALSRVYFDLFKAYHGDAMTYDDSAQITWARVPHFFGSPYYVYQYATCYASSAQLIQTITSGSVDERREGVERFLELLRAGGSDYPMNLLKRAGVDLSTPAPAEAVVKQLDRRVTQLEQEIERLVKFDAIEHLSPDRPRLVRGAFRLGDRAAGARLAGDPLRRERADLGADRVRQDARGVPDLPRRSRAGGSRRQPARHHAGALRLAAEGAEQRHSQEPRRAALGDRVARGRARAACCRRSARRCAPATRRRPNASGC